MLKAFKYRIYPNEQQKVLLNKHFGACRFVYNLALETKIAAYSSAKANISRYDLQVQLRDLKTDCEWLKDVNAQSLQASLMHLDTAYIKFFKGHANFPNFKKKIGTQSFHCPQYAFIKDGKLRLPKFKQNIKISRLRQSEGETKTVVITKTPTNKYFASILVQDGKELPEKKPTQFETTVGVDLGIKTFAVLSDGQQYDNHEHLKKSLKRLKILQRRVSRKKKNSTNRKKANLKVALLHEKITNQRKDFLHKFSDAITKQYDTICMENLNVAGMVKNHKLAQSITDVGWSMVTDFLKYKSEWRGKTYHEIGRFDASSKLHSKCGYLNKELTLADREWVCPKCGETVDRDLNAAINIKTFGLNYLGWGTPVAPAELPTLVGAMKQELPNWYIPAQH